jgi:hypothetical protein
LHPFNEDSLDLVRQATDGNPRRFLETLDTLLTEAKNSGNGAFDKAGQLELTTLRRWSHRPSSHISPKCGTAKALADDIAVGKFELASLVELTERRVKQLLTVDERLEIEKRINDLVAKLQVAAASEPQTEFARKMLMAINEIVVPAVLRREGLGFDFNSLRRMWLMGTEFQISWATSAHPQYDGWLTFDTATIQLSERQDKVEEIRFDNGLRRMADGFLDRLFEAYELMQGWGQPSVVTAWELRATFCFQNRCAPGVFDHLFRENYGGSDTYRIEKDFAPRSKPSHEEGLRVGGREIGLIRISKR